MKSLDADRQHQHQQPHPLASRRHVLRGASNRAAAERPRHGSSVEEAKAAAEAAAASKATKQAVAVAAAAAKKEVVGAEAAAAPGSASRAWEPLVSGSAEKPKAPPADLATTSENTLGDEGRAPAPSVAGGNDPSPAASEPWPPRADEESAAIALAPAAEKWPESPVAARDPGTGPSAGGAVPGLVDPFAPSPALACTPTPAAKAAPAVANDAAAGAGAAVQGGEAELIEKEGEGEGDGGTPDVAAAGDRFANRCNISRTPTDQTAADPQLPLSREAGDRGQLDPVDLDEARLQIGKLNQEIACMSDRLAKQAGEKKRWVVATGMRKPHAQNVRHMHGFEYFSPFVFLCFFLPCKACTSCCARVPDCSLFVCAVPPPLHAGPQVVAAPSLGEWSSRCPAAFYSACRLADDAFEARDEVARACEQQREIQQQRGLNGDGDGDGDGDGGRDGDSGLTGGEGPASGSSTRWAAVAAAGTSAAAGGGNGREGEGEGETGVGAIEEVDHQRVAELEAAKRATEERKQAAEEEPWRAREEASQAKAALDEAQTKVGAKRTRFPVPGVPVGWRVDRSTIDTDRVAGPRPPHFCHNLMNAGCPPQQAADREN